MQHSLSAGEPVAHCHGWCALSDRVYEPLDLSSAALLNISPLRLYSQEGGGLQDGSTSAVKASSRNF